MKTTIFVLVGVAVAVVGCTSAESTTETRIAQQRLNTEAGSGDLPVVGAVVVNTVSGIQGTGTWANPYICWDTSIAWANATTYTFPSGVYAYPAQSPCTTTATTPPNWGRPGMRLRGADGVVLKYTGGTGDAVIFDGSALGTGAYDIVFENFTVAGSASVLNLNGVHTKALLRSTFRNIRIADISGVGLLLEGPEFDTFDGIKISSNLSPGWANNSPTTGIRMTRYAAGLWANSPLTPNDNTFISPIVEGITGTGIDLLYAHGNTFVGGTSEGNVGTPGGIGMSVDSNSGSNAVTGMWFEENGGDDLRISGFSNTFVSLTTVGTVHLLSGAAYNSFYGGQYNGITIDSGVIGTHLDGLMYANQTLSFTDNGTNTYRKALYHWPIGFEPDVNPAGVNFLKVIGPTAAWGGEEGNLQIANSVDQNTRLYMGYDTSLGTYGSSYMQSEKRGTTTTPLLLNPAAGSVGVNTTTPTAEFEVNGGIRMHTSKTKPACSSTTRGTIWVFEGGTGAKDVVQVCAKDAVDAYAWRTLY